MGGLHQQGPLGVDGASDHPAAHPLTDRHWLPWRGGGVDGERARELTGKEGERRGREGEREGEERARQRQRTMRDRQRYREIQGRERERERQMRERERYRERDTQRQTQRQRDRDREAQNGPKDLETQQIPGGMNKEIKWIL